MVKFDYAAADELLAEWFPDGLAEDDPEWWRQMIEAMLDKGSREQAIEFLRTGR